MTCTCPGSVPLVSERLGRAVWAAVPREWRHTVFLQAMEWLVAPHEGLRVHAGIMGRPYTNEEKAAIALDQGAARDTPCPFRTGDGDCLLGPGGLGPHYNRVEEARINVAGDYWWLPSIIVAAHDPEQFRRLVRLGLIADVKVAKLTRNEALPYALEDGQVVVS
jgi:hypothetical protein